MDKPQEEINSSADMQTDDLEANDLSTENSENLPDDIVDSDNPVDSSIESYDQVELDEVDSPPPPESPYPGSEESLPAAATQPVNSNLGNTTSSQDPFNDDEETYEEPLEVEYEEDSLPQVTAEIPSPQSPPPSDAYIAEDGKLVRKIPHPLAEKGLRRISKEGIYYYEINTKLENEGLATLVRFGTFASPQIANDEVAGVTYESIYGSDPAPLITADSSHFLFSNRLGQMSWSYGGGFSIKTGTGRFANNVSQPSFEVYTFFVFPLSVSLMYRLNYFQNQFLVPYVEAGADYMAFAELRDDGTSPKLGGAPATHLSAGLLFSVAQSAAKILQMHREYGIHRFWLALEAKTYLPLSEKYRFSSNSLFLGLAVDY
jgi:hypothetical protein